MIKSCERCSAGFSPKAPTSRFCSSKCRQAAYRDRHVSTVTPSLAPVTSDEADSVSTVASVRRQLESAGRLDTYLGSAAVQLAQRIDQSTAVMGFAALVKELRSTMDAAMAGVQVANDPIDELRSRRDGKRQAG